MKGQKNDLFRRVNTTAHGVHHDFGGDFSEERNTKKTKENPTQKSSMGGKKNRGLDYTPLFQFLLSKVGSEWDLVHSEAVQRLDREEPIFWMVARSEVDKKPIVRVGESSYFSGLFVDPNRILALVDPDLQNEDLTPMCPCCTHTFNGKKFVNSFDRYNMVVSSVFKTETSGQI